MDSGFAQAEERYFAKISEPAYGLWGDGVTSRSLNYRGADSELCASPFISGGYGAIFIEANRFGYNFYRDGIYFASAIAQLRTQSGRDKDRDEGLKERRQAFEFGAQIGCRLPYGLITRLALLCWQIYRAAIRAKS